MSCLTCSYSELPKRHQLGNYQDDFAWCEKVGGKHYAYGWCVEDYEYFDKQSNYTKKKNIKNKNKVRLDKYSNKKKYRDKLWKLCSEYSYDGMRAYSNYYPVYVNFDTYDTDIRDYIVIDKPHPKRHWRGSHGSNTSRFYKKYSNKIIRRYKGKIPNGNWCHKMFDFWWTLY